MQTVNLLQNEPKPTLLLPFDSYVKIRKVSEDLCLPLVEEDFVVQAADFASPPKWNLGHTTWFFETFILKPNVKNYQSYNEAFNFLYNSYYESIGKRTLRHLRGTITRPTTREVYAYRHFVDEKMRDFLSDPTVLERLKNQSSETNLDLNLSTHCNGFLKAFQTESGFDLIELGAGDGSKTAILLDHFLKQSVDFTYAQWCL